MRISRPVVQCASLAMAATSTLVFAQDSGLVIYGTLNVDFESVEARGATAAGTLPDGSLGANPTGVNVPARNRVTQNSSNLGFRGTERIGPDVAAFFQIESGVAVDAGGSNIASRNTAIGLSSPRWGSVRMGQWDTPYKSISGAVDPMYFTGITYTGALIGTPGFSVGPVTIGAPATSGDGRTFANAANASYERRQGNIVQYWSPTLADVSLRVAYSANENRTSNSASVTHVNPYILSGGIEYAPHNLYFAYAYESHFDYFGLDALVPAAQATPVSAVGGSSASAKDVGEKFVGRFTVGGTQLGVLAERLRYAKTQSNAAPGAFNRYERQAVSLTLVQKLGAQGTLRGLVGKAQSGTCGRFDGSACNTSGLGARQYSIGYSETLSRRTDLYAFYTMVSNDSRGSYQFANTAGIGAAPGSSSIGYLLGIRHTF